MKKSLPKQFGRKQNPGVISEKAPPALPAGSLMVPLLSGCRFRGIDQLKNK